MINQLIEEIISNKIELSQALAKAKLINDKTENDDFKNWLKKELQGYEPKDPQFPNYRKIHGQIYFDIKFPFEKTQRIPFYIEEDILKNLDVIKFHKVADPIPIIENYISGFKEEPICYIEMPIHIFKMLADLFSKYSPEIEEIKEEGGVLKKATRKISRGQLQNIIESAKQQLLDILIKLNKQFPNLKNDYKATEKNKDKAPSFNISGNNNSVNIAAGNKVKQSVSTTSINTEFSKKLREYGVEDKEIVELKEIVENNQQDKGSMKSKVGKWLSSVIASVAAKGLYDHIPAITEIINKII